MPHRPPHIAWPTAAVLIAVLLTTAAIALAGPSLGLDDETLVALLGGGGAIGALVLAVMRGLLGGPPGSPPAAGGAAALLLAIVVAASSSGCGPGAIQQHARASLVAAHAVEVAHTTASAARGAALDQAEAEHPPGPERAEAIRSTSAAWRPLGVAIDAARTVVLTWVGAIEVALIADDEGLGLATLVPLALRALEAYQAAARVAGELGAELPGLPDLVGLLAAPGAALAGGGR